MKMIYSIHGLIEKQLEDSVVVSLSGISYQVLVPRASLFVEGSSVSLFTHLQVREDAFVLFGFLEEEELFWFRTLLQIPGIGAKTALNLLSTFSTDELLSIIQNETSDVLTKASGVGQATGKKIVLYMGEKLKKKQIQLPKKNCPFPEAYTEAKHILMDLGLSHKEANELLMEIKNEGSTLCEEAQTLVKEALRKRNRS